MKFELVEFYPATEPKKKKNFLGTVHIYVIDCELDIRGILVTKNGNGMFFNFPHFKAKDEETQEWVRYPLIRWANDSTHKEMMNFLHQQVKPEIWKKIGGKNERS